MLFEGQVLGRFEVIDAVQLHPRRRAHDHAYRCWREVEQMAHIAATDVGKPPSALPAALIARQTPARHLMVPSKRAPS
jgi:hypothetical protein